MTEEDEREAAVQSCKADLPPSRCRMFPLRPPSVSTVVSGQSPDVNTAPVFVSARPLQEASPVWPLCIPKHAYPMATDECRALQSRSNILQGPSVLAGNTWDGQFHVFLSESRESDQYVLALPVLLLHGFVHEHMQALDFFFWLQKLISSLIPDLTSKTQLTS